MKKTLQKIIGVLILVILLPAIAVTVFEYANLNENEQVLTNVYKNQLESIVQSINTYTYDAAVNWASRIELALSQDKEKQQKVLQKLVSENQSISAIYLANKQNELSQIFALSTAISNVDTISSFLSASQTEIVQLTNYYKNNYRKLLVNKLNQQNGLLYFVIESDNQQLAVCIVEMNYLRFFQNNLSQRIQSIAQNNFVITLADTLSNNVMFSTGKELIGIAEYDHEGLLWLIPNFKIQIQLISQSVDDIAKQRSHEGLILLAVVLLILLLGIGFLYVSIRRELQLTQLKSEFISNVSHEIRTPLALISMYIETLQMGRVKTVDKVNEYYSIISKETDRLTLIVNKILNFSKMDNGKVVLKSGTCNLNSITQNVLETYNFHLVKGGFTYSFKPADNLANIQCDNNLVADAIINLIDNAVKYSLENKHIEISTGMEKDFSYIEVKDFGVGISKKDQKHIFDKFFRVTTGNLAHKAKGTGLGLSIVAETVKAHKGTIKLVSKLNEGSAFRLYFPISNAENNSN